MERLVQGKYLEGRKASEEADKAKISCALWVDQVYLDEVWGLLSTVDNPSCMEDGSNFSYLSSTMNSTQYVVGVYVLGEGWQSFRR